MTSPYAYFIGDRMIEITDAEFKQLIVYIKSNYGINLTQKRNLIEGRLSNMLIEKGFTNFSDYLNYIFSDATKSEITTLVNKITTNHTFFMREREHFDYFEKIVLPYLETTVKRKDLRIWSAGCSTGEEPYTLAMIIAEYFGSNRIAWDTKVLASDISVNVLEIAERGIYPLEALDVMPKMWKSKYFKTIDKMNYQVLDQIKQEVVFRIFNLMDETFPFKQQFHTIFCRNVMIYFDHDTKMKLIQKFYDMTEPGGYLFIGHSESIGRYETSYKYVMPAVYRKG